MKKISLTWQVVISGLFSLPIPSILYAIHHRITVGLACLLILFIVPIVFCVLFGRMKYGPGSDFKVIRIIIASILWGIFGWGFLELHGMDGYYFELSYWISKNYGFGVDYVRNAFFVCYNLAAITTAVILSYALGKLVKAIKEWAGSLRKD